MYVDKTRKMVEDAGKYWNDTDSKQSVYQRVPKRPKTKSTEKRSNFKNHRIYTPQKDRPKNSSVVWWVSLD